MFAAVTIVDLENLCFQSLAADRSKFEQNLAEWVA